MNGAAQYDLIVIGGGIAGMAAATFAARERMRVLLLERAGELGGLARSSEIGGFRVNLGPRALYPPAARLLSELGVRYMGGQPPGTGYALAGGRLHPMPHGAEALLETPLFPGSSGTAARRALVKLLTADPGDVAARSLAQWADRGGLKGPALQYLLATVRLASYVDAPHSLSASAAQAQLRDGIGGVVYVDDGWQSIVDGLREAFADLGGVVRLRARAAAVDRDASGVTGVRLASGQTIAAPSVVVAVDPATARQLLVPAGGSVPPTTPIRAAVLDLAVSRLPDPAGGFVFGLDRPLYLSVHSLAARLAPRGGAVVHAARYLQPDEPPAEADLRVELDALMDQVQPGWRDLAVHQRFLPAMTVMHALPAVHSGGLAGRPRVAVEEIPGAYLAGDWVGAEHMLAAAALASAKRAAHLAVQRRSAILASVEV